MFEEKNIKKQRNTITIFDQPDVQINPHQMCSWWWWITHYMWLDYPYPCIGLAECCLREVIVLIFEWYWMVISETVLNPLSQSKDPQLSKLLYALK